MVMAYTQLVGQHWQCVVLLVYGKMNVIDRMCGRIDWAELWQCQHYILCGSYVYEIAGSGCSECQGWGLGESDST